MYLFSDDWVIDEALGGADARASLHEEAMRHILYISNHTDLDDPVRELAGRYSKAIQERFDRIVSLANKGLPKNVLINRKRNLVSAYGDQIRKLSQCLGDLSCLVAPEIFAQEDEKPVLDAELDATLGAHAEMMEKVDGAFQARDMALGIASEEESVPLSPQPVSQQQAQQEMATCEELETKLAEVDGEMGGISYGIGRVIGFLGSNSTVIIVSLFLAVVAALYEGTPS